MSLYPDQWRCDWCDGNKGRGGPGFCSDECERADAEYRRDPAAYHAKVRARCAANLERAKERA